jgi:hypothetical protein
MSTKIVGDGLIQHATLFRPVHWLMRLDVSPFIVLYTIFFALSLSKDMLQVYAGLIVLPILFSIHLFLFLLAQWSVKVRCMLGYQKVTEMSKASTIHVTAAQNEGMDRLVRLATNNFFTEPKSVRIMDKSFSITRERLEFQKVAYHFDADRNTFARLDYPSSSTLQSVLSWTGHTASDSIALSLMRWGANEYDIPIPNFLDLYLVRYLTRSSYAILLRYCFAPLPLAR